MAGAAGTFGHAWLFDKAVWDSLHIIVLCGDQALLREQPPDSDTTVHGNQGGITIQGSRMQYASTAEGPCSHLTW